MAQQRITYTETLTLIYCANCGMAFGITEDYEDRRRKDHASFYCPRGHSQSWSAKSEEEILREKLEAAKNSEQWWRDRSKREEEAKETARRQRDAYKGHTTRLKKRVAKGKCPCCSATFVNLASHMTKRHPDYVQEEPSAEVRPQAD